MVRSLNHANTLLNLISTFPTTNPTPTEDIVADSQKPDQNQERDQGISQAQGEPPDQKEADLPTLLSTIRARYRLLCTSLGVRPRMIAVNDGLGGENGDGSGTGNGIGTGEVEGIEGPMKGVDTRKLLY